MRDRSWMPGRPVCLFCLVFLFIAYICTGGKSPYPSWDVDALSGKSVTVTGKVFDRQEKNGVYRVFLKDAAFDDATFPDHANGITLVLSEGEKQYDYARIGADITANGVFAPYDLKRCEGMFDSRSYHMIRGLEGQLKRARIVNASKKYNVLSEALRSFRDRAASIYSDNMSEDDAGLVCAMTLGDRTGLNTEIKELYQFAGISHVLALSGLHIASVGLAIRKLLKKAGMGIWAEFFSFSVIFAYAVMTGMSVSTERALVMFSLFALGCLIGRTYDLLSAAALSAVIILIKEPYYIYDSGFLLSFGAVVGIACIFPVFDGIPVKGCLKKLTAPLFISLSVMIATLPATADSFMQISLLSIVINLVVIPLMGVVLFTAFSGLFFGFLGLDPGLIFKITHYILKIFELLSKTSEKISSNILLVGKPGRWQKITYAVIVVITVLWANLKKNVRYNNGVKTIAVNRIGRHNFDSNGSYCNSGNDKITYSIETEADRRFLRSEMTKTGFIFGISILVAFAVLMIHPRKDLEIRNVDVGQGDCALIWGRDIPTVMIDGGSSDIKSVAKYRMIPVLRSNRIGYIDYCFLSHMDSDHVNGVIEMLEDDTCPVRIGSIIVSENVYNDGSCDNYQRLLTLAERADVKLLPIIKGGMLREGNMVIKCLWPQKTGVKKGGENEDSLVLSVSLSDPDDKNAFTALFTGDAGAESEKEMESVPDVSYLKVGHHGSRYSTSEELLKKCRPELSVISAGVNNSYGHPHAPTLERLEQSGSKTVRTDRSGEVITTFSQGVIRVKTILNSN